MAFSHLINCILLAYGPYFVVYKAKNLFFFILFTSLYFFIEQIIESFKLYYYQVSAIC